MTLEAGLMHNVNPGIESRDAVVDLERELRLGE